jgi:hypothetical protein
MEELDVRAAQLKAERLQFETDCVQRLDAEKQRQRELESQINKYLTHMEELNKEKVDAARQLEAARNELEEERNGLRAAAEQALQSELESQNSKHLARMEELNKAKADAARQWEVAKRQLEEERNGLFAAADKRFEDHVQKHAMKMMQAISFSHLSRAVSANYAHMHMICHQLDFNQKRVLIYSHYSEKEEVESYNYLTLERMEHRFDHVIVLTNCPNKWQFVTPDYNKFHVLCYNFKSDFRNYCVFIMQAGGQLKRASQVCIVNDSFVVVDVAAFDRCMRHMFAQACDFAGITSSYEHVYHIQSYFMCFNNAATIAVVDYFDAHGLPMNHHAAISLYELGITKHLVDKGFVPFAAVSNKEMPIPLNTTHCKWSAVLQNTGIVKRQHFLKQYPQRFAMTDFNIALVAVKFSENKHFIHFLNYHGVKYD